MTLKDMIRDQYCISDKFSSSHLKKIPVFVQKAAPSAMQIPGSIQIKLISSLKVHFLKFYGFFLDIEKD